MREERIATEQIRRPAEAERRHRVIPDAVLRGRFFSMCPKTGRVMYTEPAHRPSNNEIALDGLSQVFRKRPYFYLFIYDRAPMLRGGVAVRGGEPSECLYIRAR